MIFGIGLQKTGLTSLAEALSILGLRVFQYPHGKEAFRQLINCRYNLKAFHHYDAAMDGPVPAFYPQFDAHFAGSKFILTTRDKETWMESIERQFSYHSYMYSHFKTTPTQDHPAALSEMSYYKMHYDNFINLCVYKSVYFHSDRFSTVYDDHHLLVQQYFSRRSEDFLVLNILEGDGWEKLCPFLDCEQPAVHFPHKNVWATRLRRMYL